MFYTDKLWTLCNLESPEKRGPRVSPPHAPHLWWRPSVKGKMWTRVQVDRPSCICAPVCLSAWSSGPSSSVVLRSHSSALSGHWLMAMLCEHVHSATCLYKYPFLPGLWNHSLEIWVLLAARQQHGSCGLTQLPWASPSLGPALNRGLEASVVV